MEEGFGISGGLTTVKRILWRILAVFTASGLSVLGAGAIVGVEVTSSILMAGILGVASVIERLARAFLEDGKLTIKEINDVFSSTNNYEEK